MKLNVLIVFVCVTLWGRAALANDSEIDSLINLAKIETNDSVLLQLYNQLGSAYNNLDVKLAGEYWSKAFVLATKTIRKNRSTYFLNELSNAANGMGIISTNKGRFSDGISYYQRGMEINEELQNFEKLSLNYKNIGVLYRNLKEYDKSLEYYQKYLSYKESINDTANIIKSYLSIGIVYRRMGNFDKALNYYNRSLRLSEQIGDKKCLAEVYSNIGVLHNSNQNYAEAITFLNKGFEYIEDQDVLLIIAKYHHNISFSYTGLGALDEAILEGESAYNIYAKLNMSVYMLKMVERLSDLYAKKRNYKKAYTYFRKHILLKDSIDNYKVLKEIAEKEIIFDQRIMMDSLARIESDKVTELNHQQEIESQQSLIFTGALILILVITFSIFVFNRLKITSRQKMTIENQKIVVEKKNKEITDSINYAKRIQSAILPSLEIIKESLPKIFVIYKPKDIVAGDFYWYQKVENKIFIAVADCTGHGVPGAMVSVVCYNALNRAISDFGLQNPAKILDKTTELVVQSFKENKLDGMSDGMDISLCSYDLENKKLEYAGAINSLFCIRQNKFEEIKGDRQPIGRFSKMKPFTLHKRDLSKGDRIYMFSDGYADQFGGVKGKKYMYKRFRNLIKEVNKRTFVSQKGALEEEFRAWRNNISQVDDICIIGIEV